MKRKNLLKIPLYLVVFALLAYCERITGLHGFAFAFCVALVFCRENLLLALIPYAVADSLVHFDLYYLAVVSGGVTALLVYSLIAYKAKKKYRIWTNAIVIAVSQIPVFFLFGDSTVLLVKAAVSLPTACVYHYVSVAAAYPVLVRGAKYNLTDREKAFAAVFVIPLGAALAAFNPFGVGFFFFAVIAGSLVISSLGGAGALGYAVAMGIGGAAVTQNPYFLAACAAIGGAVCAFGERNRFLSGIGAEAVYFACCAFLGGEITVKTAVPAAVGCLVAFIPGKAFARAKAYRLSFHGKFALRTLANRDREEVGKKLRGVATAFRRMQGILESESEVVPKPVDLAEALYTECCSECGKKAVCGEKIGVGGKRFLPLATAGMNGGRAVLTDVGEKVGANCVRLPRVIATANAFLRELRIAREKRSGESLGREMVTENLGGTADLLEELASGVSKGFGFDAEREKLIADELACSDVIAGDVAIYDDERITLSVRECDEKKPQLRKIVSAAAGTDMYVSERSDGVNGAVNLVFRPTPVYGVLYGEKSVSAESECGDAKQAVRVASDKLMFVLSDGMGTGADAKKSGVAAISLIETFYRAGFGHKTIFGCVSRLLALRSKETFSALDVAVMDTRTGEIDFIKQGGRESYVFSSGGVSVIEGGALPMGIIEESEPIIVRKKLNGGDMAVMISDGVADRLNATDVAEIIGGLRTLNPQIVAEKIVENALKRKDGHKDDMTAMVLRVVKNGERA